mmetsp:Transcript_29506/g.61668  ORF Transcript_29506/g.61668 Transcript_29506/m.61668 type:complete len:207 (+) Transcript_29506:2425-3045(+)
MISLWTTLLLMQKEKEHKAAAQTVCLMMTLTTRKRMGMKRGRTPPNLLVKMPRKFKRRTFLAIVTIATTTIVEVVKPRATKRIQVRNLRRRDLKMLKKIPPGKTCSMIAATMTAMKNWLLVMRPPSPNEAPTRNQMRTVLRRSAVVFWKTTTVTTSNYDYFFKRKRQGYFKGYCLINFHIFILNWWLRLLKQVVSALPQDLSRYCC